MLPLGAAPGARKSAPPVLPATRSCQLSAPAFFVGKPRPGSRFAQVLVLVDLRVPTSLNRVMKEPFLNVELRDDAGIGADDLEAQLGRPTEIDVPEPNPRSAVTYVYALRPSRVRFSIGLEPARRVVGFSIDRPGDSR
jgi:hypothetical protein